MSNLHRRDFLKRTAQLGAVAGVADLAFLHNLPPLTSQQVQVPRAMVQLTPDIEPLVRLIEERPRNQVLEAVAERIAARVLEDHRIVEEVRVCVKKPEVPLRGILEAAEVEIVRAR